MIYRFGVVGAGMIAPYHVEAINGLENAEVVGLMDHGSGRASDIVPGLDLTGADDLDRFLARDDIDVITIATPSGAHLEATVKAAQAGKHCIVEKPIEVTLERIDTMIAAHATAGTQLGGIFNTRYTDAAQLVKRTVESGRLGRLTFASALGPWWRDQSYYDTSDWKGTWALDGGGATMNQGIHSVDQLQWIVGSPVTSVSAYTATLAHERIEVEDTSAAAIQFANGALGTIACTTSMWPGHFRTLTVAGDAGTVVLADDRLLVWQFREEEPEDDAIRSQYLSLPGKGVGASDPASGVTADGHRAVIADFLAALDRGDTPEIDGRESRKAVSIIRAIYESAERGGSPVQPR